MNPLTRLWILWKSLDLDSKLTVASLALMGSAWLLDYVRNPDTTAQLFVPIIALMMLVFYLLMVAEALKREKKLQALVTREVHSLRSELATSLGVVHLHGDLDKLGITSVCDGRDDRRFLELLKASNKEVAFMAISFYHHVSIMRTELPPLLAEKQLRIKVLVLQPESPFLEEKEREEGIPGRIKGELNGVAGMLREITRDAQERGYRGELEVRRYSGIPYCSMYLFDESTILYNPYLRQTPGKTLPVFEITNTGGGLFRAYRRHFASVWTDARTEILMPSDPAGGDGS